MSLRANAMICLINQVNFLLDQQIAALEKQFMTEGGYSEQLAAARLAQRTQKKKEDPTDPTDPTDQIPDCPACGKVMLPLCHSYAGPTRNEAQNPDSESIFRPSGHAC